MRILLVTCMIPVGVFAAENNVKLPEPFATPSARNYSKVIPRPAGAELKVPRGMLDFTFYTGKQFPQEYQGGAFLAWHGSWNRAKRQGYQIAFVPFAKGKPSGPPQDFLTGWMLSPDNPEVWGRPVAVLQMPDGSLLVSDDGGKKIWRVSYPGKS